MHLRLLAPLAAAAAALSAAPVVAHAGSPNTSGCSSGTIDAAAIIPDVLQGAETAAFQVTATPQGAGSGGSTTLSFAAGQTQQTQSIPVAFGTYTVHETAPSGWQAQPDRSVTLSAAQCTAPASFSNAVVPAQATFQVATLPAGGEAGWTFTLVGPGAPAGGEKLVTTGPAATTFATPLQEGLYTVAETTQTGWDQTGATGCVFTVDYPADAGRSFACSVQDTREGQVTVAATHGGQAPSGADAFHFVLSGGPGNVLLTQVAGAANHGSLDFGLLEPGSYTLCQQALPSGWSTSLVAQGGLPDASGDICLPFSLAAGQTRAFSIDTVSPAVTATPTPTATATPQGGVQGVNAGSGHGGAAPSAGSGGGTGGIAIPNTGVGLSGLAGIPLLLLGGGLVVAGRRRGRRR